MNRKYFGILTEELYESLSKPELDEFLEKNGLTEKSITGKIKKVKKGNEKGKTEMKVRFYFKNEVTYFSTKLINLVYSYLKEFLKGAIDTNTILYNREFTIKTYGYSEKKKRKEALKNFNTFFFDLCEIDDIGISYDSENNLLAEKRFDTLHKKQQLLISILKPQNPYTTEYLFGNGAYFARDLFDNCEYLLEVYNFEKKLSILLDINKKYNFEVNNIFTPKPIAEIIFDEYKNDFQSLKQLQFIEEQFKDSNNKNYAFAVSLFYFFSKEIQISLPKEPLFREIIITHFKFSFSKIKLNYPDSKPHQNRIKKLKEEWSNF